MTEAEGTVPPDVAEALLAVQGLVNEIVAKTVGAALSGTGTLTASVGGGAGTVSATATGTGYAVPTGSGAGAWSFTGTGTGQAPPLTPEHATVLRGYVSKVAAGTVVAVVAVGQLDGLASFAERIAGLLP